ncbi:hypothetical protein J5N97_002752 [Dioscorea zingiberensis]|uniref:Uncharacterized protein n=1 Tax=Dioscorea zingiberensis TaxID=325984 RepID=A0A9D5D2W0_9LILI|nr:hypothetical protein J5N97_002752 [Dioscorea zingiberensis]
MKRVHKTKPGGRVHPSPAYPSMAALPAAVLALVAVLTPEEREVLAYLISGDGGGSGDKGKRRARRQHEPELGCDCFGCYKSFWARWDASPNRHLIHRILDAFEEKLQDEGKGFQIRRGRRSRRRNGRGAAVSEDPEAVEKVMMKSLESSDGHVADLDDDDDDGDDGGGGGGGGDDENGGCGGGESKSSVLRFHHYFGNNFTEYPPLNAKLMSIQEEVK